MEVSLAWLYLLSVTNRKQNQNRGLNKLKPITKTNLRKKTATKTENFNRPKSPKPTKNPKPTHHYSVLPIANDCFEDVCFLLYHSISNVHPYISKVVQLAGHIVHTANAVGSNREW